MNNKEQIGEKAVTERRRGMGSRHRQGHGTDARPWILCRGMSYLSCATAALTLSATGWGNGA